MILLVIPLIFLVIALIFFSFPELSPVPYFPSNQNDKDLILKGLNIRNDQAIIDFGAGDGWVLFEAARVAQGKKFNTKFVLVEINPFLILVLHFKRLLHPNKNNITILRRDIFKVDMKTDSAFSGFKNIKNMTIYMYVSPRFLPVLTKKILEYNKVAAIVTYFYALPDRKPNQIYSGKHNVYLYNS